MHPTGLRIVCDHAEHASHPRGCPKTFRLLGSLDNVRFEPLFSQDYYDYVNEYANGGVLLHFFWEAPLGRVDGHRCGSCDMGPAYTCHLAAYDSSCSSRYCDNTGRCSTQITCPPGHYLEATATTTQPVPAGASSSKGFGATTGEPLYCTVLYCVCYAVLYCVCMLCCTILYVECAVFLFT